MSAATELARAEADAVEAEEAEAAEVEETEPAPEPAPEPEPEPAPPVAAVDPKKIERAVTTYFSALEKALGPDMGGLSTCPKCVEYVPGLFPVEAPPEPVADPGYEPCDQCKALGFVLSGSLHPDHRLVSCTKCNGKGYNLHAIDALPSAAVYAMPASVAAEPWPDYDLAFIPLPNGAPDAWKRPAGHPRWGFDPSTPRQGV